MPSNANLRERELAIPTLFQLRLKRDPEAPSIARAATSGRCERLGFSASLCHTLTLLVSELVSNALLHSSAAKDTPIVLTTSITENAIRVTVTDMGEGFTPKPRIAGATDGGYGLYIVDKEAIRWGVDRVGGTRVWFELPRTANHPCHDIEKASEPMSAEPRYEQQETNEAAREAREIGGSLEVDERDPARRPVNEAGGGEAEGFEESERALIEHASHGDQQPAHAILHDQTPWEEQNAGRQDGEADHERSSETNAD